MSIGFLFRDGDGGTRQKWGPWLLALVPAIFAGIFSIAPYAIEKISAPKSKLEYTILSSPSIRTGDQFENIISVTLINTGDAKLTNVDLTVTAPIGVIQTASLDRNAGDRPLIAPINRGTRLTVRSMFPREKVGLVLLVQSQAPNISTSIAARSDQVLGELSEPVATEIPQLSQLLLISLAMLGSATSSLAVLVLRRTRGRTVGVNREDAISVIAAYSRLERLKVILLANHNLSFAHVADLVFLEASSDSAAREECIKALKCLLIVPPMNPTSREIVEGYLSDLGAPLDSSALERVKALRSSITNHFRLRLAVRSIFDGSEQF